MAVAKAGRGSVIQLWSYPCPQGYRSRAHNASGRELVDYEGLALVRVHARPVRANAEAKTESQTADGNGDKNGADRGSDSSLATE
jgi:hypothetical protein